MDQPKIKVKKTRGFFLSCISGFIFGLLLIGIVFYFKQKTHYWVEILPTGNLGSSICRQINIVEETLNREYFDKEGLVNQKKNMQLGAIKGFVDALNDPYTLYLDAEQMSGLNQELEGERDFEGIGATIEKKEYYVQVVEILKNSPAFKSGIQPLDRIVMIGTGETKDMDIYEAVKKISGPKGTSVDLTIERIDREGVKEYLTLTVIRDLIQIPSLKFHTEIIDGKKIGFLEILVFGEKTESLLNQAIREFIAEKIDGIILDLRGNGGGFLMSAVDIAEHFLEPGELIVSAQYHHYENKSYYSKGFGELASYPIIILVNELTASAGEILAIALHQQLGAPILGTQTFGKGSIQTMIDFPNGETLKYTVGNRYSPTGENLNGKGISPNIEIPFNFTGYIEKNLDNQLGYAKEQIIKEILKTKEK